MESGIHGCGIRNPQAWNPESTAWNPESKTLLDYLTWGETWYREANDFYLTITFSTSVELYLNEIKK